LILTTTPQQTGRADRQPVTGRTRDLVIWADKAIFKLATHWLALVNLFWGLYVGLPVLAPVLMDAGWTAPAKIIYTIYRPACHQMPTRSYFFGGEHLAYSPEELAAAGLDVGPLSRDIGNETVGWKFAFCQRDVAIYGSLLLGGLVFALARRWRGNWLMPFRYYLVFLVPMGVDGLLQLFGFYESNWLARTITGTLFGAGSVLFAYPYLEEGFADVRQTIQNKLHPV
jgi:uncharacterized membrane protein